MELMDLYETSEAISLEAILDGNQRVTISATGTGRCFTDERKDIPQFSRFKPATPMLVAKEDCNDYGDMKLFEEKSPVCSAKIFQVRSNGLYHLEEREESGVFIEDRSNSNRIVRQKLISINEDRYLLKITSNKRKEFFKKHFNNTICYHPVKQGE